MYTRESLELVMKEEQFPALKEIGKAFGVKSTSSKGMIDKILAAQNGAPVPSPSNTAVELLNLDELFKRKRNMEVPINDTGAYFLPLVAEDRADDIEKALMSFAHQWNFGGIEFFLKFQAFRLYKKGKHVDWIGLNEVIRRYELKIPLAARTIAKRLYTAPDPRAYK